MNSTTAEELFDPIVASIARKQSAVCQMIVENVKDRVGINVEIVGNRTIRSRPGEPPRRDTANLQEGIDGQAIAQGDLVEAAVWADAFYAAELEKRQRPILTDLIDNYLNDQLDAGVSGIEGE